MSTQEKLNMAAHSIAAILTDKSLLERAAILCAALEEVKDNDRICCERTAQMARNAPEMPRFPLDGYVVFTDITGVNHLMQIYGITRPNGRIRYSGRDFTASASFGAWETELRRPVGAELDALLRKHNLPSYNDVRNDF